MVVLRGDAAIGQCRGQTYKKAGAIRAAEGCADAAPTTGEREGNKQKDLFDCPAKATTPWDSDGKKRAKAFPGNDSAWARHAGGAQRQ